MSKTKKSATARQTNRTTDQAQQARKSPAQPANNTQARKPVNNKPTRKPENQQTSKPANKPTRKPENQQTSKPANQPARKPVNQQAPQVKQTRKPVKQQVPQVPKSTLWIFLISVGVLFMQVLFARPTAENGVNVTATVCTVIAAIGFVLGGVAGCYKTSIFGLFEKIHEKIQECRSGSVSYESEEEEDLEYEEEYSEYYEEEDSEEEDNPEEDEPEEDDPEEEDQEDAIPARPTFKVGAGSKWTWNEAIMEWEVGEDLSGEPVPAGKVYDEYTNTFKDQDAIPARPTFKVRAGFKWTWNEDTKEWEVGADLSGESVPNGKVYDEYTNTFKEQDAIPARPTYKVGAGSKWTWNEDTKEWEVGTDLSGEPVPNGKVYDEYTNTFKDKAPANPADVGK